MGGEGEQGGGGGGGREVRKFRSTDMTRNSIVRVGRDSR